MAVEVKRIAEMLSVSYEYLAGLLRQQGICVADADTMLSDDDLRKLEKALADEKARETAKRENTKEPAGPEEREEDAGGEQEYLEEQSRKRLEYYLTGYRVFIDTCSLLHPQADLFWEHAVPILRQTGVKLIVPYRVVQEIEKHCGNPKKPDLALSAAAARRRLMMLKAADLIEIRGEATDNFSDNVFQSVFIQFRIKYKLLLITQDRGLATDILSMNSSKSVRGQTIQVRQINKYGYLSGIRTLETGVPAQPAPEPEEDRARRETAAAAPQEASEEAREEAPEPEPEKFALSPTLTDIPEEPLPVSSVPGEGDMAWIRQDGKTGKIRLLKAVASGGEGTIYTTNTPYVAKIYRKDKINKRRCEKISLMLSRPFHCEGICYPTAAIYNTHVQLVGYLMPKAQGKELQKSLFVKPLLLKNYPTWKKRDTVELCITILEKIKYLHERNIIMGDINPSNILVVSPKEVYFVDTDSYQIEGFPCPVGTVNYTAPEIQRLHFDSFLRTVGNENFAVATLLFMIMLPGKPPYSQQGGESPIENIVNMDFSYPLGEQSNKKTPDGPWRYIWSHLPYDIKEAFYQTFRKDGENSLENTRLTVDEWLTKFRYYLKLLDSGKFGAQDRMSEELFPTRYKKNPNVTYVTCSLCGREVAEDSCKNGICRECLNTGEVYRCGRCGKEMIFTNYQKYIKNAKRYEMCPECFANENEVYTTVRCVDCGASFDITNRQHEYFQSKGFALPKRCENCRKRRQNESRFPSMPSQPSRPSARSGNSRSSSGGSGSWCFITTAVCDYFGKPDDCYELTTLRSFRDHWLRLQPDGPALIKAYYASAPSIVARLDASPLRDAVYHELWRAYINPCISHIEKGENALCKEKYIGMIDYLKDNLNSWEDERILPAAACASPA